ncbi:YbjN domain-containing protein [Herbaspirillum frisingense]|uniref:YbjN domain-containing protein n=1 Tax=Herbaspirillum frisingense TaxID=92645 RepID=UPI001F335866|nr:YbjN domain-containing protein [Herbaspirillum frisingense]UIN21421.1 YbjN domain-containing protein [Herbaspirillum frisingense]
MSKKQETSSAELGSLIHSVSAQQIGEAIKAAGCAVTILEQNGFPMVHSASHGVGFQVLWGNPAGETGQYLDFTLSTPLRVQEGVLPEGLIAEWHRSKRFARVVQHGEMISLEMDVIVAGGVSASYLNMVVQLWTQMMGQFFLHLRNFDSAGAAAAKVSDASNVSNAPAAQQQVDTTA